MTELKSDFQATEAIDGYVYQSADQSHAHAYLIPVVISELAKVNKQLRVFDLGCGNGSVANELTKLGHDVTGVDPSVQGIGQAKKAYPNLKIDLGSAYDPLKKKYGTFDAVVSLEVVEHVYAPRDYARTLESLLQPGGIAIISTPYHGYLKNLALAVSGKLDSHFTALWDHGHIKFWSIKTLTELLGEAGLSVERIHRVGRIPALAKSMILIARKPD